MLHKPNFLCLCFGRKGKQLIFGCLFMILFFFLQNAIVNDYGVHWDEYNNQGFGYYWVNHIITLVTGNEPLHLEETHSEHDVIHGPFFEMFLLLVCNYGFQVSEPNEIIETRHFLVSLTFLLGNICLYILTLHYFRDWRLGLLGNILLICNPRIFAHSFYNSVDIPFLCFYIFNLYSFSLLLKKNSSAITIIHAMLSAMLIDIRLVGAIIPCITILFLLFEIIFNSRSSKVRWSIIRTAILYLLFLVVFTIIFWPYLWQNPIEGIWTAITTTTKINWDGKVLFCGQFLNATNLPRTYLPVWMIISIPIGFLSLFFMGCATSSFILFAGIRTTIRSRSPFNTLRICYKKHRYRLLPITVFFAPFILVIISKPIIYDSWRHLFFLYPPMCLVMLYGVRDFIGFINHKCTIKHAKAVRYVFILLISISIINTIMFMIDSHPFQQVFFNRIAGRDLKEISTQFELDYWGLSYRKGLEYLLNHDSHSIIVVYDTNLPIRTNAMILPTEQRKRLRFDKNLKNCKYFITNFRNNSPPPNSIGIFFVEIDGGKLLGVYRINH